MSRTCHKCGIFVDGDACPICGEDYASVLTIKSACEKYKIPEDKLMEAMAECPDAVGDLTENCIIYFGGMVDAYSDPDVLMSSLSDSETLMCAHEDIALIIVDGQSASFKRYNRVEMFIPESWAESDLATIEEEEEEYHKCEYLISLSNPDAKPLVFNDTNSMLEWIDKNDGKGIYAIFIKGVQHSFEIIKCFKLQDSILEIEEMAF